jgi:oligopeptidase A
MTENPLRKSGIPNFPEIQAEHVGPAVDALETSIHEQLQYLENEAQSTWEDLVLRYQRIEDEIEGTWGPVGHLMAVRNTDALRQAYDTHLKRVVQMGLRIGQSQPLFQKFEELSKSKEFEKFDSGQRRTIENVLREMKLSGIGLEGRDRERFNDIMNQLSQLSTQFSNHVLDAVKKYHRDVRDRSELAGLPDWYLQMTAATYAKAANSKETKTDWQRGPWRLTLDQPAFFPIMKFCSNRRLREEMYKAYVTRASSGEDDNTQIIYKILELRAEKAKLLGFSSFAELSISRKMAGSVDRVFSLLTDLLNAAREPGKREHDDLKTLAYKMDGLKELCAWDTTFYAERQQEQRFGFKEEDLKPYFALESVLTGLFQLVQRIFSIRIVPADGTAPVWHQDVRFFDILDDKGQKIAAFFLDPFARSENKRGGAWMNECLARKKMDGKLQAPVAYLVCNFPPPIGKEPSLLTFRDVETMFHEFGHGLQHMLTLVDHSSVAGIRGVEWDAVELPSQFMENWCYHRPTLLSFARHWQTGAPLPDDLFNKLVLARTFRAASMTLRQLHFATLDLELHHSFDPQNPRDVFEWDRQVAQKVLVSQPIPDDRMLCSFAHIFAGGYAAGYYSYKWAEVLSADAFAAFEDAGLDDEEALRKTGMHFRETILGLGGSVHPMDVFKAFRGREPSVEALLRHNGLIA